MTHSSGLKCWGKLLRSAIAIAAMVFFAQTLKAAPPVAPPALPGATPGSVVPGAPGQVTPPYGPPEDQSPVAQIVRKYTARHYSLIGPLPVASIEKNVIYFPRFPENKTGGLRVDLNGKHVTVQSSLDGGMSRSLTDVQPGQRIMVAQRDNDVVIILMPKAAKENLHAH